MEIMKQNAVCRMKHTLIILAAVAAVSVGCKQKAPRTNQTSAQTDTVRTFQQEPEKYYFTDDKFNRGLKRVENKDRKWGFIDSTGNEVIPLMYDRAFPFGKKDYTLVELNNEMFYIDKAGRKLNGDSIFAVENKEITDKFITPPRVSAEVIAEISPVIKKWTEFYKLDFANARRMRVHDECFNCVQDDTNNINYYKIDKDEDTGKRIDVDYSPNKRMYVSIGLMLEERDGKYYHQGWAYCQSVRLVDRNQKHATTVLFNGALSLSEAAFWKSDSMFIVVSRDYNGMKYYLRRYSVDVFDISKQVHTSYDILKEHKNDNRSYLSVYFKEKGIIDLNN
jgi:hypothetical protein